MGIVGGCTDSVGGKMLCFGTTILTFQPSQFITTVTQTQGHIMQSLILGTSSWFPLESNGKSGLPTSTSRAGHVIPTASKTSLTILAAYRSEERRVGKECRSR